MNPLESPLYLFPPNKLRRRDLYWCHVTYSITCNSIPSRLTHPQLWNRFHFYHQECRREGGDVIISFSTTLNLYPVSYLDSLYSDIGQITSPLKHVAIILCSHPPLRGLGVDIQEGGLEMGCT
ncbi:hypothetical protein NPIL_515611 [Nephila pilipes]|uniref:Uncharacterized protein n=1 Tax=Nephila pilipes TaxID=299642 RepID=A0A8X6TJM0_NEPPI|nr:hypothetical protein NPIL_515611 [Nephila pilipes]